MQGGKEFLSMPTLFFMKSLRWFKLMRISNYLNYNLYVNSRYVMAHAYE